MLVTKAIYNLVLYIDLYLFKDTLFSIYFWFSNIEFMTNSTVIHTKVKHKNTRVFSIRHITDSRNNSVSALPLEAILNSKIKKKYKSYFWNLALNRLWRGHFFMVWELKKKAALCLVRPHLGTFMVGNQIFHPSVHVHEWGQKHCIYWFWRYRSILASRKIHKYIIHE